MLVCAPHVSGTYSICSQQAFSGSKHFRTICSEPHLFNPTLNIKLQFVASHGRIVLCDSPHWWFVNGCSMMSQMDMPLCNAKNRCYHWSSSRAPESQCCLAVAAEHTWCMLMPVRHLSSRHSLLRIDHGFCIAGRGMIWGQVLLEEQDHFWRKWSIRCAICNHLCVFIWLYVFVLYSIIIHI